MDGVRRIARHQGNSFLAALHAAAAISCACAATPAEARAAADTHQVLNLPAGDPQEVAPGIDNFAGPSANGPVILNSHESAEPDHAAAGIASETASHRIAPSPNESRPLGSDTGWMKLGSTSPPMAFEGLDDAGPSSPQTAASALGEAPKVIGALAVVLGVIGVCLMALRRFSGLRVRTAGAAGMLEVLARYPLGRGHSLLLLKLDHRILLLHQGGQSMTALSEVTDAHEVAGMIARIEAGAREGFATKLQNALRRSPRGEENPFRRYVETVDLTRTQGSGLRALQLLKERGA